MGRGRGALHGARVPAGGAWQHAQGAAACAAGGRQAQAGTHVAGAQLGCKDATHAAARPDLQHLLAAHQLGVGGQLPAGGRAARASCGDGGRWRCQGRGPAGLCAELSGAPARPRPAHLHITCAAVHTLAPSPSPSAPSLMWTCASVCVCVCVGGVGVGVGWRGSRHLTSLPAGWRGTQHRIVQPCSGAALGPAPATPGQERSRQRQAARQRAAKAGGAARALTVTPS